jgi:hypothetical protein
MGFHFSILVAVAFLVAAHFSASKLHFLGGVPRSRWLSGAGGASVAYVFVHLIPELSEHQEVLKTATNLNVAFLDRFVYLIALLGLATYYGLERASQLSRAQQQRLSGSDQTGDTTFWFSIVSFGLYNTLIGYLLFDRLESGVTELFLFTLAMALHFVISDFSLHEHHKDKYSNVGRWLLTAAIVSGTLIGAFFRIDPVILALLVAFLGGGIILNVLKEELPQERESRFGAFFLGAAGNAALLLFL